MAFSFICQCLRDAPRAKSSDKETPSRRRAPAGKTTRLAVDRGEKKVNAQIDVGPAGSEHDGRLCEVIYIDPHGARMAGVPVAKV